jgi:tRNA pseudouridine13 synthase
MANFYGVQRFGTVRPITHEVGRLIVHEVGRLIVSGDFKGAMMTYLAKPFPDDRSYEIRKRLWDTHDFKAALIEFPLQNRFRMTGLMKCADVYGIPMISKRHWPSFLIICGTSVQC